MFLGSPARAESDISLYGVVIDDSTGAPVEQATVRINGTAFFTATESDGSFSMRAIPVGTWSLAVERSGYHPRKIDAVDIVEGFTRQIHVALEPNPVRINPQKVEATFADAESARRVEVSENNAGAQSVSELLETIPGVRVYGGSDSPGGTRISVGGEPADRVAVLLDGLPLSGGADGAVDLSTIPLAAIAAIEIHPGSQTVIAGDAAIGGTVNLVTRSARDEEELKLVVSGGQWGGSRQEASVSKQIRQYRVSAGGEYDQRRNPYRFIDPKTDTAGRRQHSQLDERRAFLKFSSEANASFELLGYASRNERGAPGTIEQPLNAAFTRNKNARIQTTRDWEAHRGHRLTTAAWYEFGSEYYNASANRIPQHSYLREQFLGAKLGYSTTFAKLGWKTELETRYRQIHGVDIQHPAYSFGDRDRIEYALRSKVNTLVWRFSLHGGLALDADRDNSPGWSPRLDLHFSPARLVSMGIGWGRSFKRPLLLTAFWKGDYYTQGNPDLKPERAEEWEASIRLRHRFITVESRYFERTIDDIIVWDLRGVPQKYTPVNLASAEVVGREDFLQVTVPGEQVSFSYSHVFNAGTDHSGEPNYEGMTLPFMPRHTHDVSVHGTYKTLSANVNARWVSLREGLRANSNRWQPPYRVLDADVRVVARESDPQLDIFMRGENLTNEAYELLYGYPSPARTISAGIIVGIR